MWIDGSIDRIINKKNCTRTVHAFDDKPSGLRLFPADCGLGDIFHSPWEPLGYLLLWTCGALARGVWFEPAVYTVRCPEMSHLTSWACSHSGKNKQKILIQLGNNRTGSRARTPCTDMSTCRKVCNYMTYTGFLPEMYERGCPKGGRGCLKFSI